MLARVVKDLGGGDSEGTLGGLDLHPRAYRAGFSSHHGSTSRHFTSRQLRLPASEAVQHGKSAARDDAQRCMLQAVERSSVRLKE